MNNRTLCGTGVAGTVIAAVCCFTPALVVILSALGLAAWLRWADYVLLPAMVLFFFVSLYGLYRLRQERAQQAGEPRSKTEPQR